jgi:hypothetical protein
MSLRFIALFLFALQFTVGHRVSSLLQHFGYAT